MRRLTPAGLALVLLAGGAAALLVAHPTAGLAARGQPDPAPSGARFAVERPTGRISAIVRPAAEMVRIPAGPFTMGSPSHQLSQASTLCMRELGPRQAMLCTESSLGPFGVIPRPPYLVALGAERPSGTVYVSAFEIDRTEVTNADWRACVAAGACLPAYRTSGDRRFDGATHPVVAISHREATAYCAWRQKRLPTEAEWEKAARGTDGRIWPWGNRWDGSRLNHGRIREVERVPDVDTTDGHRYTAPVGSYPKGKSPYGVLDLAGNVAEWVDGWYTDGLERSPVNPRGARVGSARIVRGGSWFGPRYGTRSAARAPIAPEARELWVGFRCARDLDLHRSESK
jgi:formylglycine-generating enzyme required for sulfatase activity